MAGRPGRDRLTAAAADPVPGRRRSLLVTHLALGALLGAGAIVLVATPSMFTDVVGLLLVGELVLLGLAASIGALYDRFAPLVLVDVLIGTPVVAALTSAESLDPGLVMALGIGISVAALAGSIVAATRVRHQRAERVLLAGALVVLGLAFWSTPLAAAVPVIAMVVLATPDRPAREATSDGSGAPRGAIRRPARPGQRPDAGAVLAVRTDLAPADRSIPAVEKRR